MLKLFDYYSDEYMAEPCVLLLGYFDGMHAGHRALLNEARSLAAKQNLRVGALTFRGSKNGSQVYVFEERLALFERLKLDFVLIAPFDKRFRATSAGDFAERLFGLCNVRALVCGEDFSFGKGAAGNAADLVNFAAARGATLTVVPPVDVDGRRASASLAKEYLAAGDIRNLNKLLIDRYFISGRVQTEGRHVGAKLGFPTANLHPPADKFPVKEGVYAVSVPLDQTTYRGIANYGPRPTFGDDRRVFEIYVRGYAGDLYGKELTVYFDDRIRDIQKFESAQALAEQLKQDLEKIK